MDDFEGDINPNILEIKEGSFSKDNTDTEAVSIVFVHAENRGESDTDAREYYDNVTDQGKIKGEKREWSAFTAETGDAAIEVLQTEINGNYIEVTLYIEDAKSPEPLEDSMILKILDTITC